MRLLVPAMAVVFTFQLLDARRSDWNPLINGAAALLMALALAVPGIMAYLAAKRMEAANTASSAKATADALAASKQNEVIIAKTDVIASDAAVIKGHVNSEQTALIGKNETLKAENALLRETLAMLKEQALALATGTAAATLARAIVPSTAVVVSERRGGVPAADPATASLEHNAQRTADNTERTADNTKRTEEKVTALEEKTST